LQTEVHLPGELPHHLLTYRCDDLAEGEYHPGDDDEDDQVRRRGRSGAVGERRRNGADEMTRSEDEADGKEPVDEYQRG